MSYSLNAPTTDPVVIALRRRREELRREVHRLESALAAMLPTPVCRLCRVNGCDGTFDWTVCGPCYNKHNGKPPKPEVADGE